MPTSNGIVNAICGQAEGALHIAADDEIEKLVGASQLHVRLHRDGVVGLEQRIHELNDRDRLSCPVALGEVIAFEHLSHRVMRGELQDAGEIQWLEPLGVVADLEVVLREEVEELVEHRLCVGLHLIPGKLWPGHRLPRGVSDSCREVADDEHGGVPLVLELAQLSQRHRPPERHIARGWIDAELHAQGTTFF